MQNTMKRSSTVQAVLCDLRRRIVSGELEDKSPVKEIEFSNLYGCSRAALRGAIAVLEQEGLITVNPNGTKRICSLSVKDINNLYALRSFVECSAAAEFLKQAKTDITKLLKVIEYSKTDSSEGFLDSDTLFHETLVSLSGNKALIQTWRTFAPVTKEIFNLNFSVSEEIASSFTERHEDIVIKLFNKDPEAVSLLRAHIEEARILSIETVNERWKIS